MVEVSNSDFTSLPSGEPQRKNNWKLVIELPVEVNAPPEVLTWALKRCPLPGNESEVLEFMIENRVRTMPGHFRPRNFELTLTDYLSVATASALWKWRDLSRYPPWTSLKTDGTLILFAPDLVSWKRKWSLQGIWPSSLSQGEGDMSSGDVNLITVTFQVDDVLFSG